MTESPQNSAREIIIGTPSEVLQRAAAHYNAAEYAAAMAICQEVIEQDPENAEALHILGHIATQTGALDTALGYFVRAVSIAPTEARFNRSFAIGLEASGRSEQAIHAWSQFLLLQPDDVHARRHLARLYADAERHQDALATLRDALALAPGDREIHLAYAVALHRVGSLSEAIDCYRALIEDNVDWAPAHNNLGLALIDADRLDEAAAALEIATGLQPDDAEIQNNLGVCQARRGDRAAARQCFDNVLALRPGWPEGHLNLANVLRQADQLEDAVAHYQKAIEGNPTDYRIYGSLALTQMNMNQPGAAIASYRRALDLEPKDPELRKGLGIAQLLGGDLRDGWRNYEARLDCDDQRHFDIPRWTGEDLAGRSILVYAEQGFGDTVQFCRYLERVAQDANPSQIVFECQRPLSRLLQQIDAAKSVVARGDPLPKTDFQVPLLSLPAIFDTTLENIPAAPGYLTPLEATEAAIPPKRADRKRVGIVWKGNPLRQDDDKRSCPIDAFAPITGQPEFELYSLQTDASASERQWLSARGIHDLSHGISDFTDTAAHIAALDLIVSVDTATAHLAGALGGPVWVILGASADWRYLIDREDCPWYPSMRLFRQAHRGNWIEVVERLATTLKGSFQVL